MTTKDDTWHTVAVTAVSGWSLIHQADGGGFTADASPAILLQQAPDGSTRATFAAIDGANVLPADEIADCVGVMRTSTWEASRSLHADVRLSQPVTPAEAGGGSR
jgi:hypothetical protein